MRLIYCLLLNLMVLFFSAISFGGETSPIPNGKEGSLTLKVETPIITTSAKTMSSLIMALSYSSADTRRTAQHKLRQEIKNLKYLSAKGFFIDPQVPPEEPKNSYVREWAKETWTSDVQRQLFHTAFPDWPPNRYGEHQVARGILLKVARIEPALIEPPLEALLLQVVLHHPSDKISKIALSILTHIERLSDHSQQQAITSLLQSVGNPLLTERAGQVLLSTNLNAQAEEQLVSSVYHRDPDLGKAIYRILKSRVRNNPHISLARSERYKQYDIILSSYVSNRYIHIDHLEALALSLFHSSNPLSARKRVARLIENHFELGSAENLAKELKLRENILKIENILITGLKSLLDKEEKELIAGILKKKAHRISKRSQLLLAQWFREQPSMLVGHILKQVPNLHESAQRELVPFITGPDPYKRLVISILKPNVFKRCVFAFRSF